MNVPCRAGTFGLVVVVLLLLAADPTHCSPMPAEEPAGLQVDRQRTLHQERARDEQQADTSPTEEPTIDFDRARRLLQKRRSGAKLTPDEEAYLQRAMAARQAGRAGRQGPPTASPLQPRETTGLVPLSEMSAEDRYQGQDGGLYGQGSNSLPDPLRQQAETELARIEPLDRNGHPSPSGTIGFISISMSNATQEFSRFKQIADADPAKSPRVTIIDCAQGGQAMAEWVDPRARPWQEAARRISAAGVSPEQIQVAWIKLANKSPRGDLQEHGTKLHNDTLAVIQNAKAKFPNLRVAYLGSRIYGAYTRGPLNPEPYAYESALVVRGLIQAQIDGHAQLNFDSAKGPVHAPLLLWGPYFWADGVTPRKADGLVWLREDFAGDGTHPSPSGREKVARILLDFFKTDPLARGWFAGSFTGSRRPQSPHRPEARKG
jgi:hypothetical protein